MHIFLVGWFGAGNLGDEAIALALAERVAGAWPQADIDVLSFGPARTAIHLAHLSQVRDVIRVGAKLGFLRSDFRGLLRALGRADLVVVGGGLFQDIYNWYTVPFFTLLILLAKRLGATVVLCNVGFGPLETWLGRRLSRLAANAVDLITVRDPESLQLLTALGIHSQAKVAADVVFTLDPAPPEQGRQLLAAEGVPQDATLKVSLCVQALLPWGDSCQQALVRSLRRLIVSQRAHIVFVPFGRYLDRWLMAKGLSVDEVVSDQLAGMLGESVTVIHGDYGPREMMALLGQMDLVISMRLHGLVMSLAMGVPTMALTYRRETKLKSLMNQIGEPERSLEVESLTQAQLDDLIGEVLGEDSEVARRRRERVAHLRRAVTRSFDEMTLCHSTQPGKWKDLRAYCGILLRGLGALLWDRLWAVRHAYPADLERVNRSDRHVSLSEGS